MISWKNQVIILGLLTSFSNFHCKGCWPFRRAMSANIFSPKSLPQIDFIVSVGASYGPLKNRRSVWRKRDIKTKGEDGYALEILCLEMMFRELDQKLFFPEDQCQTNSPIKRGGEIQLLIYLIQLKVYRPQNPPLHRTIPHFPYIQQSSARRRNHRFFANQHLNSVQQSRGTYLGIQRPLGYPRVL
jgi:hypothetical protein